MRNEFLVEECHTSQDEEHQDGNGEDDDLKSRLFRLRFPKRSASNILQKWASEGRKITTSDLQCISGDLCKFRHYKHALEIPLTRMEDKVRMRDTKKSWEEMKMMMMREMKKSREQKMLKTEMNFLRSLDLGLFIVLLCLD
ncbi:hypothetical protein ACSBR2_039058 [Camellia fascicularis]